MPGTAPRSLFEAGLVFSEWVRRTRTPSGARRSDFLILAV